MDISNRDVATALRCMAWERAKGELRSMLHPFWREYENGKPVDNGYKEMEEDIEKFIKHFEGNYL
jgi:hypothetical protein